MQLREQRREFGEERGYYDRHDWLRHRARAVHRRERAVRTASANATKLLADMASPINGVPAADNNDCTTPVGIAAENTDGDNFYCVPKGQDLAGVFVAAASSLTSAEPRLVK